MIEQEYMSAYIGCCVSPGTGATVRLNGSSDALKTYAAQNRCTIVFDVDFQKKLSQIGTKLVAMAGEYASLSCRERDRR